MMPVRRTCAVVTALALATCASAPDRRGGKPRERIAFVEGGAGKLRVSDGGSGGTPVVFVHGLGSDLEVWRAQLDHLRPARRAIAYDQRGHGGSAPAKDASGYTIEALAGDLDRVVRALHVDRFFLVGHSLGGAVLTAYAAAHPDKVAGLVYADAVGDFHKLPAAEQEQMRRQEASPAFAKDRRAFFGQMLGAEAKPATRERVLAAVDRLDPPAFSALRHSMAAFQGAEAAARYQGPRLAIEVAGRDFPVMFSALDPSAPKVKLEHVSHWLMLDDPDGFDRALDRFVGFTPTAR